MIFFNRLPIGRNRRQGDKMRYDPIKDLAARLISFHPAFRELFFRGLDLLLLRQRYVKREINALFPIGTQFQHYDAGAGFCQYSWYSLKRWPKAKVFATDLKRDYLADFSEYASQKFPGRFFWKSADLQVFKPQRRYDLVTAIDILEHIPDDRAVLANFHAALKEGGTLLISVPSDTDEAAKFTSEHVRPGYSKQDLEQKLIESGFELEKLIHSYGTCGSLSWRLLMKYPLSLLNRSKAFMLFLPFWYLLVFPIAELLMRRDLSLENSSGTGLIAVARKPSGKPLP